MKKLILNILILIVLVAAANWCIDYFFYNKSLPYYWGDTNILEKRSFVKKNKDSINTLFLGSSKTHYQVNPKVFDSIVNQNTGMHISSYNFGVDAMLPPESFYVYQSLLQNESFRFKNVIMELDFLQTGDTKNLFNWRSYYWLNKSTYNDYSSVMLSSNFPSTVKAFNLSLLNLKAVQKLLNIGKFNEYVQYRKLEMAEEKRDTSHEVNTLGFTGLPPWKTMSPALLSQVSNITNVTKTASANYDAWSKGPVNKLYASEVQKIMKLSRDKGINLIFLIPVQWNINQYKELFPIIRSIPEKNKILMFDYESHKPLFTPQNLFDDNHVNSIGAKLYTAYVAQQFIAKLNNQ